eukprot:COSAG02_NODE_29347_length_571_cov_0.625000_1_plen_91_part_10
MQDAAARQQGCAADALDLRVAWRAPTGPESGVAETAGLNAEENRCDSGKGTGEYHPARPSDSRGPGNPRGTRATKPSPPAPSTSPFPLNLR